MFRITIFTLFCLAFSPLTSADGDEHEHHGHRHGHHYYRPVERVYYERAPQYAPPPRYNSYDPRSHQGLAGGVIGSVLGYELGAGNPIASGLGAAAGSYVGNGMAR
nr:hypothetical protein [Methylovulum miyakonense]